MSGGGNKKKIARAQGWEEAGAEFYQESYPAEVEFDVLQRDPQRLATLLPSKQSRAVAAATMRIRTSDNRTFKRQTSSRSRRESTVHRRTSTAAQVQDIQVSMLPDLSENISNEQMTWEEIMQLKTLPISMRQKREMKAKILNEPNLRLQGYEQFKWKRRKMWKQFETYVKASYSKMEPWRKSLKKIEGHYGTGVVAYFLFLRWLFFLNLFTCLLVLVFIMIPNIYEREGAIIDRENCTTYGNVSNDVVFNLVQGQDIFECSAFFYGYYLSTVMFLSESVPYNLPLAYMAVAFAYFIISLISIVKAGAKGFKERLIEGEGQFYFYCNLVFGGWDFCIHNEKSAAIKHKAIYNEIKATLEAERIEEERQSRTSNQRTKLVIIRVLVNLFVLTVLATCAATIYFVFTYSTDRLKDIQEGQDIEQVFLEFSTSITIVGLNVLVPFVFDYLAALEHYSLQYVLKLTLIRTVFLRLSSLIVLYITLYMKITGAVVKPPCWETYVGQQIYKLYLTDFAVSLVVTFFINFPRAFLARHCNNRFIKFIGEQTFFLPRHVLDVVYFQTLIWLGSYYAPVISILSPIFCFLLFYIKQFACLVNSQPSGVIYRASRSKSMFMLILLISFIFALLPLIFSVSEVMPSSNCGPFRNKSTSYAWRIVEEVFTGTWWENVFNFVTTAGFAVPTLIILLLLLYYYTAINSANRHMVKVLKNQLVLEGHDKQFLLDRLSMFLKQQQEQQKRLRRNETLCDSDRNISSN